MQCVEGYIESGVKMLDLGVNDVENAFAAEAVDTMRDKGKISMRLRDIFFRVANDSELKEELERTFDEMLAEGTMKPKSRAKWQRILDSLAAPVTNPEPADDEDMDPEREGEAISVLKDHSAEDHTPTEVVGIRLHDVSLQGPLDGCEFKRASFPGCYFGGTSMQGIKVLHSDFETAEMRGVDMSPNGKKRTVIVSANFGDMLDANLNGATIVNTDMTVGGLSLRGAILVGTQIRSVIQAEEALKPFAEGGVNNTWFIGSPSLPAETFGVEGANIMSKQQFLDMAGATGALDVEIARFIEVDGEKNPTEVRKEWSKRLMEVYNALKDREI